MNTFSTARSLAYFAVAMTIATQSTDAQDRSQGRSMVISRNGIVAAESPLAAQTGAKILERGGDGLGAGVGTEAGRGRVWPSVDGVGGELDYLRMDESAAKTYLPGDRAPKVGEVFRNPDLAWSLEQIAEHGREAFYKGEIAAKILESMKRHNGPMAAQDLAEYSSEFVEPISTTYRDWTVYELPPNEHGLAALEMLHIMETFPLGQKDWRFGSTLALHALSEAKKLAYADLAKYIGDPRKQKLPVATLLSKAWAAQSAMLIDADKANCDAARGG